MKVLQNDEGFSVQTSSGCCTNDLNQFAMATPRGATESIWIVCFGNVCKQIKLMQKVLKWVTFLLLNFQKSKQTRQKPNGIIKWTQQCQKLNFHCVHWQQSMNSPLISNRKLFLVTRSMTNDLCGKTDQLIPKDRFRFWQLRQQTIVTEPPTGESSVLRLLCDSPVLAKPS